MRFVSGFRFAFFLLPFVASFCTTRGFLQNHRFYVGLDQIKYGQQYGKISVERRESEEPLSDQSKDDNYLSIKEETKLPTNLTRNRPPILVEDAQLLLYDIFLLLNLSVSISFWVVNRSSPIPHISHAFSEGSLLCLLWVIAGLGNGVFLYSAVDAHYGDQITHSEKENERKKGGPQGAGLLAFNTFVTVCSFRIIIALAEAVIGHRHVGDVDGEMLIPLELGGGLILISFWRMLHSQYVPR